MTNLAAIVPAPKAPLEVHEVEFYKPGPHESLVKNEVIAFNPVEYKIAKLGIAPLKYPAILGSTFGGTVEALGVEVTDFDLGDRVVVSKKFGVEGNQYGAYQRYVVAGDLMVSKVSAETDLAVLASLMMNLTCVVGLFSGRLSLDKPSPDAASSSKATKILIYGGSSSFGRLSVQYLARTGYTVYTTSSPKNKNSVSKLGAADIFNHNLEPSKLMDEMIAKGPYDVVVDVISLPETVAMMARVLAAQGGKMLYVTQPAFGPEAHPDGVTRVFEPWSDSLYEESNFNLLEWVLHNYLPYGLLKGAITPLPVIKIARGLMGVNEALDRMQAGAGDVKLVADPWE